MSQKFLTTSEAAAALGISTSRVRHLISEGRLPAEKRGRDLFIRESDLKLVAVRHNGRPPKKPERAAASDQ